MIGRISYVGYVGAPSYPANASPEIVKMIDLLSAIPDGAPFVDILVSRQISNVDLLNKARENGQIGQQPYLDLVNWLQIARSKMGAPVDTSSPAAVAAKQMTAAQYDAAAKDAAAKAAATSDPTVQKDAQALAALATATATAANDPGKSIVNMLPTDPTAPGASAVDPGSPAPLVPYSGANADANPQPFYKKPIVIGGGLAVLAIAAWKIFGRKK